MQLNTSKSDLKAAFTGLKGVFKRLVTSNLAGHLPISAYATFISSIFILLS